MIKLLDILKEAKQVGPLYHWTSFDSLILISKYFPNFSDDFSDISTFTNDSFKTE
jgi:hypothetical protein